MNNLVREQHWNWVKRNDADNLLTHWHGSDDPENDLDVTQLFNFALIYNYNYISHLLVTLLYTKQDLHNNNKLYSKDFFVKLISCTTNFHVFTFFNTWSPAIFALENKQHWIYSLESLWQPDVDKLILRCQISTQALID